MGSFFLDDFFFVFYNYLVIGDFDDFLSRDGELRVGEAFDEGAPDDDLLDSKILACDGEVYYLSKMGAFFGFNFEANNVEV